MFAEQHILSSRLKWDYTFWLRFLTTDGVRSTQSIMYLLWAREFEE